MRLRQLARVDFEMDCARGAGGTNANALLLPSSGTRYPCLSLLKSLFFTKYSLTPPTFVKG